MNEEVEEIEDVKEVKEVEDRSLVHRFVSCGGGFPSLPLFP